MDLSLVALSIGMVAPLAAVTAKLRHKPRRLASYHKILLPQQTMLRLVHLETARAERNGTTLTMVIFAFPSPSTGTAGKFLEEVLPEKIRLSDAAGWLSDRELAVLLPETSVSGARTFVTTLRKMCGKERALPSLSLWRLEGKWVPEQEHAVIRPAEPAALAMSA